MTPCPSSWWISHSAVWSASHSTALLAKVYFSPINHVWPLVAHIGTVLLIKDRDENMHTFERRRSCCPYIPIYKRHCCTPASCSARSTNTVSMVEAEVASRDKQDIVSKVSYTSASGTWRVKPLSKGLRTSHTLIITNVEASSSFQLCLPHEMVSARECEPDLPRATIMFRRPCLAFSY